MVHITIITKPHILIFQNFLKTDQQTDRPTDKVTYKDASRRLKTDSYKKQDRETRSMAVPEVTIYNLLLKPQAFSFECLYLKKTTGNLSIYVPQK